MSSESLKEKWIKEQTELAEKIRLEDPPALLDKLAAGTLLVGGLDISFSRVQSDVAVATLTVVELSTLKLVHHQSLEVCLTIPYIPTFLGYRELEPFTRLVTQVRSNNPQYMPDVFMIDGNGTLHPRRFGSACQFGLTVEMPCLGVAKNLLDMSEDCEPRVSRARLTEQQQTMLNQVGDRVPIYDATGQISGVALRNCPGSRRPVYVSPGHMVTLETACTLTLALSRVHIPEPIKHADLISRREIRRLDSRLQAAANPDSDE